MAVLAVLAPGRFGGHAAKPGGPLRWQSPARTSTVGQTPSDHLLFARVVNHSGKTIRLRAAKVHVLDAKGRRLQTRAAFADGFVPGVMLSGYGELYADPSVAVAREGVLPPGAALGREAVLRSGGGGPRSAPSRAPAGQRAATLACGAGRVRLR